LFDLNDNLHVSKIGFPPYNIPGGDQQVYAVVKNLKKKKQNPLHGFIQYKETGTAGKLWLRFENSTLPD
jgi:hypothetical protein